MHRLSASALFLVLVACAESSPPEAQSAANANDWQARIVAKHRKRVAALDASCKGGNSSACAHLGVQYVVPYKERHSGVDYTDDSFPLDPAKGLPMVEKGCREALEAAAKSHDLDEDDGELCRVLLEHGQLDPAAAEKIADDLCQVGGGEYFDLDEIASRKNGHEDKAKSAHAVYAGWYCLYWSDHTSEYSSEEKLDKLQAMCDEAKAGDDKSPSDGCQKDTDCKGDRICDQGTCKAPK